MQVTFFSRVCHAAIQHYFVVAASEAVRTRSVLLLWPALACARALSPSPLAPRRRRVRPAVCVCNLLPEREILR